MNTDATKKVPHPTRSTDREANERFVHLRNANQVFPNGRMVHNVTAFVRTNGGVDFVSFAECDARDAFNRKVGRVVARRKWFNNKRTPLLNGESLYDRCLDTWYESTAEEEVQFE